MPIDPSIIMGLKPATFATQDPLDAAQKSLALQHLMGAQDLQGVQVEQARQGMADDAATRQAYMGGGTNSDILARLRGTGQYKAVQALEKAQLEAQGKQATIKKDTAAADKSQMDIAMDRLKYGGALLSEARDQQSWESILRLGQATGIFAPEFIAQVPKEYNPAVVAQLQNAGVTRAQQLEDARKREEIGIKNQELGIKRQEFGQKVANDPFTAGPEGPTANTAVQNFLLEKAKKGATNVNVKTDVKMGESLAGQIGPMMRDSTEVASAAVKQVDAARQIIKALDSNKLFTGPGAEARLKVEQVADALGLAGKDSAEKLANTRTLLTGLAQLTLQGRQQMRGQGAVTESEGKLAERAASGDINFSATELRTLSKAAERAARWQYNEHNRKLKIMQENPNLQQVAPFYQGPAMPAESAPEVPGAPPAGFRPL